MRNKKLVHHIFLVFLCCGIFACGGKRNVEEDRYAKSTEIPEEQLSHRQAKKIFLEWISIFASDSKISRGYDLLTEFSKKILAEKYSVHSSNQFVGWFLTLRASETPPFHYSITRIDIVDIFATDSLATITATFQVRQGDKTMDEVGTFFLRKNKNEWRIPFAESPDWTLGWWEREMSIESVQLQEGFISYRSETLGIQFIYPQTWDIIYPKDIFIPSVNQSAIGIELSYTSENEIQPHIFVRFAALSPQATGVHHQQSDSTSMSGFVLRSSEPLEQSEDHAMGRAYTLEDPTTQRTVYVLISAPSAAHDLHAYQSVVDRILSSIRKIRL